MNKLKQIILHAIIWIAIVLYFMYNNGRTEYSTVVNFVYFGVVNISLFYINYLIILPTFLNRKKYLWCALSIFFVVMIFSFIKCGLAYYFYDIVIKRGGSKVVIDFWYYYSSAAFVSCFFILLSTVLKFIQDWFLNEKVKSNLENENLIAELAFLKSQINPHFLFNSLNNIYSLAYQKSEKTPEAILKLSEIMRYMLYESNEDKVELSNEIRYLENYIELQKLRFKDNIYIKFEINGDPLGLMITPLVLISFVENAFKHGIATDSENPISIVLNLSDGKLLFHVSNIKSAMNKDITGGIGLQNVQRRLSLIYKDQYCLQIDDNNDIYTCELYLNL
ncbi:sensor histidine kinase [Daejeonella sp.]|uniref:sensor histidine kinase n=1 Tax=Daejeonella sp. TaxID=2805397 RepID=UPI0027B9A60D|nr:sensor histidine kinase [Daejeonella sp.]